MKSLTIQTATERMNAWGALRKPFFFLLDFDLNKPVVLALDELEAEGIRCRLPQGIVSELVYPSLDVFLPDVMDLPELKLQHDGYPFDLYRTQFERVMEQIRSGNSFLVNLTCSTNVRTNANLFDWYQRVKAKYVLLYKDYFLVFSPETFVRIKNGLISSCPMKGTIDASLPDAKQLLLENAKEAAEHATIVDLIRNDLSMVSTDVRVANYRYVDEIQTDRGNLLQVSSEITGKLPQDYTAHIGDILMAMLPAGSVTGAPKKRTVEIIRSVETYQRGYYTGIFGIFDGTNLDSAVLIRFLENSPNGMVYKSGGGITAFSQMENEYQEMLQKIYVPLH